MYRPRKISFFNSSSWSSSSSSTDVSASSSDDAHVADAPTTPDGPPIRTKADTTKTSHHGRSCTTTKKFHPVVVVVVVRRYSRGYPPSFTISSIIWIDIWWCVVDSSLPEYQLGQFSPVCCAECTTKGLFSGILLHVFAVLY